MRGIAQSNFDSVKSLGKATLKKIHVYINGNRKFDFNVICPLSLVSNTKRNQNRMKL